MVMDEARAEMFNLKKSRKVRRYRYRVSLGLSARVPQVENTPASLHERQKGKCLEGWISFSAGQRGGLRRVGVDVLEGSRGERSVVLARAVGDLDP